ncbi:MAG: hypothetical protein VX034_04640 [Planctomycetota bacterium]|nr:hypothetical protein [Planctomycetota bacterium]
MSVFLVVDDKHVPQYRVLWNADVPHFFGAEACTFEGHDEIRLEGDESVWSNAEERDTMLDSINQWQDR